MKEERGPNYYEKLSVGGSSVAEKLGLDPHAEAADKGNLAFGISYSASKGGPDLASQKLTRAQQPALEAIERALDKIEAGGFGYCDTCGHQLPLERLVVNPTLEICNRCEKNKR